MAETPVLPRAAAEPISIDALKRHAGFLASDTLEGRQAGTQGGQAAAAYLVRELKQIGLQPAGNGGDYRQLFGPNYANVLAQLPGTDATLHREFILIGAHFDHVGFGSPQNSYGPYGQIHNGADDNASGVSVLLELARFLAASGPRPRTVVFAFWDAEEAGLLGSRHWLANPTLPKDQLKLAINVDMIGRLREDRVIVMGWRSAAGLRLQLAEQNRETRLAFRFEPVVTDDSDHYPFYAGRIPTLHFDTAKHDEYHRPSDDVPLLNWNGMARVGTLLAGVIDSSARAAQLPAFRPECWQEPAPPPLQAVKTPAPVRLGVIWKTDRVQPGRLEVLQVTPGYPAATAGLRPGDALLAFGDWKPGSVDEFRSIILAAPEEVSISWVRGDNTEQQTRIQLREPQEVSGLRFQHDPALPGAAVIQRVIESSPADQLGLWPGDVLLSLDGKPITGFTAFTTQWQQAREPRVLQVERRGIPFTVRWPKSSATPATVSKQSE